MTGDAFSVMWEDACAVLDRAERMQRQFIRRAGTARHPNWLPPIDVIETRSAILVEVALPGVDAVEVVLDCGALIVRGERAPPHLVGLGGIRRLEIPHGRFARRIDLPPGHYELREQALHNGCLVLALHKLD